MAKSAFQEIPIMPLSGLLDTLSRPANVPIAGYRWRQNFSASLDSQICRRQGFLRGFFEVGVNGDHHHQGDTREQITFLFESTSPEGNRKLYDGTQSRISHLDETTGLWTDIATGKGDTGTRWHAAQLQDTITFTNNHDDVLAHTLGSSTTSTIPDLILLNVRKALVVTQFSGFVVLMNLEQDGQRRSSRVRWSDLNKPLVYDPAAIDSIAGFQDLDYGDDILAAAQMGGVLLIYTTRSIWRAFVASDATAVFSFQKIYSEPRNQAKCLAYPNTLVSTGNDHYYMGRDGIYHFNPYLAQPERGDEKDSEFVWAHLAAGVIFTKADTKVSVEFCNSPIAEYRPSTNEILISWPSADVNGSDNPANNWTLALNTSQRYADIIDTGFTAFVNYRPGESSVETCNEDQLFLGVSGIDWSIKQIGDVFYREFVTLTNGVITDDIPLEAAYVQQGYNSILRGLIPLGFPDREKTVRNVLLDADTAEQDVPCVIALRIGTSYGIRDPNEEGENCPILWTSPENRDLDCPDGATRAQMQADNTRPNSGIEWTIFQIARYLYFELTIKNANGTPAIGGDTCWAKLAFDAMASPKA